MSGSVAAPLEDVRADIHSLILIVNAKARQLARDAGQASIKLVTWGEWPL